jgi:hypothetical protein
MLDLLTPKELLNMAGIVSTKCLKNGNIDGIPVSVGVLGAKEKFSQTYKNNWLELGKWRWFYVTKKSPGIKGKRSLGSNGTSCSSGLFTGG